MQNLTKYAAGGATIATLHSYADRYNTINNNEINNKLEAMETKINEITNYVAINKNNFETLTEKLNKYEELITKFNSKIIQAENELKIAAQKKDTIDLNSATELNTASELNSNNDLISSASNQISDCTQLLVKFLEEIKKGTGSNSNNFLNNFNSFFDYLSSLSTEHLGALGHIFASIFILFCLFSLISVFYGEKLIEYFNVEKRFPSLSNFIKLRRKFQHYYFLLNVILIVITLIYVIYVNLIVLSH